METLTEDLDSDSSRAVKETGIIFRPEMVRAILEGKKMMTRRVVKPQPVDHHWKYLPSLGFG